MAKHRNIGTIVRRETKEGKEFFQLLLNNNVDLTVDGEVVKFKKNAKGYADKVLSLNSVEDSLARTRENVEAGKLDAEILNKIETRLEKLKASFVVDLPASKQE